MTTIVHLSDLHLLGDELEQAKIVPALMSALATVRSELGRLPDLVVCTGDVFDSAAIPTDVAASRLAQFGADIERALGAAVPAVVVPGNHDRRRLGIIGPHRAQLFDALPSY